MTGAVAALYAAQVLSFLGVCCCLLYIALLQLAAPVLQKAKLCVCMRVPAWTGLCFGIASCLMVHLL